MKKVIFIAVVIFMISVADVFAAAGTLPGSTVVDVYIGEYGYAVNRYYERFDVAPYEDTTVWRSMVAARPIAEAFGASVLWDARTKTLTVSYEGKEIKIIQDVPLPNNMGTPRLVNDRFMVPLRYFCYELGLTVGWSEFLQSNQIIKKWDDPIPGGYTADRAVTADDLIVFNEAMAGLVGVNYEPTLVATQVVAGTNYRFTAKATPVVLNPVPYQVYIYIFKPLQGPAQLTEIVNK